MKYSRKRDAKISAEALTQFMKLLEAQGWSKRLDNLVREANRSPFMEKVILHFHWLELELDHLFHIISTNKNFDKAPLSPASVSVLDFSYFIGSAIDSLNSHGANALSGRVRDSLKSSTGFSSLYQEFSLARRLAESGYEVEFSDLENKARFDLFFSDDKFQGEVECKSVSIDAGRKIHQCDFYRLMSRIEPLMMRRIECGASDLLRIVISSRLPSDEKSHDEIFLAAERLLANPHQVEESGSFFRIKRDSLEGLPRGHHPGETKNFYRALKEKYGESCHVAGPMSDSASCVIAMRSEKEDDHTAPILEGMKEAASQLSKGRPAFISVQFDDVSPRDLEAPHVRDRMALMSHYLYSKHGADHVIATVFTPYGKLEGAEQEKSLAGILVPNPQARFKAAASTMRAFGEIEL